MSTTPNLGLALPAHASPDWDTPLNSNFTIIDGIAGGGTSGDVLTSNGPNTAPTYQPIPPPVGGGSVTSVALTAPTELAVAGSPITTAGTLALTKSNQSANTVWAGPTSGGAAQPSFRALVASDIPFSLPSGTSLPAWWGSFEGGQFQWTGGGNGRWGTGVANQVKFCLIRIPYPIQIRMLTYNQLSVLASSVSGYAIYDSTGQVKLLSWDNINTASGGGTHTTTITPVVLQAGVYYAATSCSQADANNPQTLGGYGTGGTNEPVEPWNTNGTIRTGVAGNVLSGGVMPAALGTLNLSGAVGVSLPSITMEP